MPKKKKKRAPLKRKKPAPKRKKRPASKRKKQTLTKLAAAPQLTYVSTFLAAYLETGNMAEAARRAGETRGTQYKNDHTAAAVGHRAYRAARDDPRYQQVLLDALTTKGITVGRVAAKLSDLMDAVKVETHLVKVDKNHQEMKSVESPDRAIQLRATIAAVQMGGLGQVRDQPTGPVMDDSPNDELDAIIRELENQEAAAGG